MRFWFQRVRRRFASTRGEASDETRQQQAPGICYFLVCFKDVEYVSFLLSSIYREQDLYVVHCDKKAPAALAKYVATLAASNVNIVALPSEDYSWAGYSHVEVTLRGIEAALAQSAAWTHFVCLSEQHLPLRSPGEIADAFEDGRSWAAMRPASSMIGAERADIESRFSAIYRELPGVGCFAVGLAERDEAFYKTIFHGSNWLTLCRDDCRSLLDREVCGEFDPFKQCVHAEETAIPSVLMKMGATVIGRDTVLVAFPHLTDNHSLVMTDELFFGPTADQHLFIRKRQKDLSPAVTAAVKRRHFVERLAVAPRVDQRTRSHKDAARLANRLSRAFPSSHVERVSVEHEATPLLHVMISSSKDHYGVHVLSENLKDFRVTIIGPMIYAGVFEPPRIDGGMLRSTVRAKVFHLFGYEDLCPIDLPSAGFISLKSTRRPDEIMQMVRLLLEAIDRLP